MVSQDRIPGPDGEATVALEVEGKASLVGDSLMFARDPSSDDAGIECSGVGGAIALDNVLVDFGGAARPINGTCNDAGNALH